ncbi:iron-sulfur cluster assembly accessory protein [Vibrio tapetis]|uniref:Fe-S cluster assembly protein n=1 Tax=Vibrio tapetis subsp. tapetis TaxID=1671868 RepID=A0A2N8ZD44_9VIBR|nr:iron-sulfur cluster assembly accessory protein [Vibrio tapetis]MDN3679681.1 iron-sulfur cluster assembly accessory protein [Vibrio tapetis subsp. quintayensis]SON49816.1 Fe-S cluster assembly protein [Vibrio tapetis subsp. tapetis]
MTSSKTDIASFSLQDEEWQGISLTPSAAKRISQLSMDDIFIMLSVKPSGCTGYAYVLDQVSVCESKTTATSDKDKLRFESHGCSFYVALEAMPFVDGTEIDYVREGLNQTFVYHNPNVTAECGCGESFGV